MKFLRPFLCALVICGVSLAQEKEPEAKPLGLVLANPEFEHFKLEQKQISDEALADSRKKLLSRKDVSGVTTHVVEYETSAGKFRHSIARVNAAPGQKEPRRFDALGLPNKKWVMLDSALPLRLQHVLEVQRHTYFIGTNSLYLYDAKSNIARREMLFTEQGSEQKPRILIRTDSEDPLIGFKYLPILKSDDTLGGLIEATSQGWRFYGYRGNDSMKNVVYLPDFGGVAIGFRPLRGNLRGIRFRWQLTEFFHVNLEGNLVPPAK